MQVSANQYVASISQARANKTDTSRSEAAVRSGASAPDAAVSRTAYSKAPGVSAAVGAALLRIQETGSVFNREDTRLMYMRGVSNEDRQRFNEIVQDAAENGGYNDPLGYIKSLSRDDIDVLQRVHSLAEPKGVIGVTTEEGAFNLLLPQSQQVDTNDDAIVERGLAKTFVFPPVNSPQAVKDAWDEATAGMTEKERMLATAPFMAVSVAVNVKYDAKGESIGLYEPGDKGYANIFGKTGEDWTKMLSRMIDYSRSLEAYDSKYIQQTKLLVAFSENLTEKT